MKKQEIIKQLYDLIADRKSFLSNDIEANKVFEKDIEAIKYAIEYLMEVKK